VARFRASVECDACGELVEWVCAFCEYCNDCCDCDELFDADELGLDPEEDDQRRYGGKGGCAECPD